MIFEHCIAMCVHARYTELILLRAAPILLRNCFGRGGGLWPAGAGRRVPYPLVPVILACRRGSGGSDRLAGAGRWPFPRPVGEGGTPIMLQAELLHATIGGGRGEWPSRGRWTLAPRPAGRRQDTPIPMIQVDHLGVIHAGCLG